MNLHLPHPHIAERVAGLVDRALHRHFEADPEITQPLYGLTCFEQVSPQRAQYPRPVYPPGWDWVTPDEWLTAHTGKENRDA